MCRKTTRELVKNADSGALLPRLWLSRSGRHQEVFILNKPFQGFYAGTNFCKTSQPRLVEREEYINMNSNIGKFPPEAAYELVVRCRWNPVIYTKLRNRSTHNVIIVRISQLPCHQPSLLRCYFFSSCPLLHQASSCHLIRSNDLFFDTLCWLVVL